jgi:hypothetical protein
MIKEGTASRPDHYRHYELQTIQEPSNEAAKY